MALAESEMVKVDTAAMIANRYFLAIKTPYKKQSSSGIAVAVIDALKTVTPTAMGNRYFLTLESPCYNSFDIAFVEERSRGGY
jgi:hypothetical protein